ncbi:MAG: 16S rRNA (cytidine(1402)-2'-O)-methyltransferase [Eubacteriales bacterium]|nr:16S rRNA (cytidine(1402)-2'-O)-methyltransferase [Eubacteriales bacterium]
MLYIVATPIGNLEDITLRALRVLREADMIAAEDTRRTIKLLNHYGIKTKLMSFHEHSGPEKRARIIDALKEGRDIALVSDAGTPLISDPGAVLVAEAAEAGIGITSLPGACAAVTAMTLSGFGGAFVFIGFLPKNAGDRKQQIARIASSDTPCVVYETPHKLGDTLKDFRDAFGEDRHIVVAKELTKVHESVFRGPVSEACRVFESDIKGEYVIITGAKEEKTKDITDSEIKALIETYIESGMTKKDAAKAASDKFGINKNRVYKLTI